MKVLGFTKHVFLSGPNQDGAEGADGDDPGQHCDPGEEDGAAEGEAGPAREGGGLRGAVDAGMFLLYMQNLSVILLLILEVNLEYKSRMLDISLDVPSIRLCTTQIISEAGSMDSE